MSFYDFVPFSLSLWLLCTDPQDSHIICNDPEFDD